MLENFPLMHYQNLKALYAEKTEDLINSPICGALLSWTELPALLEVFTEMVSDLISAGEEVDQ